MIPNMKHEVEACRDAHPEAWKNAHTGNSHTHDFIRLLGARLHAIDPKYGLLGQYGNPNDLAEDAILYLGEGPGHDVITGQAVSGFDVISGAGGTNPQPAWNFINQGGGVAWVKPGGVAPEPPDPPQPTPTPPPIVPGREEALDELNYLDYYYSAPEGLQRPNGLSLNGKPDFEGIAAWYLDVYQQERMKGKSRPDSRAVYVSHIRHSDEWRAKHPGETP